MRNRFDYELEALHEQLIEMGAEIEEAIGLAIEALIVKDVEKATMAVEYDAVIDRKEREIERLCLSLLLKQQPVAKDLRLISAALKMITDMERIGDQAADIAEIVISTVKKPEFRTVEDILRMATAASKMVTDSVDAFVNTDLVAAHKVIDDDDEVDNLFNKVRSDLVELIMEDTENSAETALDLMMIAKYLERIGDHAVNIAGWVVFSITGNRDVYKEYEN